MIRGASEETSVRTRMRETSIALVASFCRFFSEEILLSPAATRRSADCPVREGERARKPDRGRPL